MTRSTSRNGKRCGSIAAMSRTSSGVGGAAVVMKWCSRFQILLDCMHTPGQFVEVLEPRRVAAPFPVALNRRPRRILARRLNGMGDQGHGGHGHAIGHAQVAQYASTAADQAVASDR